MNLDLSKVQSLIVTPMGSGIHVLVTYKSTRKRGYTFSSEEAVGLGVLLVNARKANVPVSGMCDSCGVAFPTTSILYVDTPLAVCDACAASIEAPKPDLVEQFRESGIIPDHEFGQCVEFMGEPCDLCLIEQERLTDVTSPQALVEMLALTPAQAAHLAGATRLNFWRNGCLNLQIEHGNRAIKVKCPDAIVTEQDLCQFFAGWGWKQLGSKPYFKPEHDSLVRL